MQARFFMLLYIALFNTKPARSTNGRRNQHSFSSSCRNTSETISRIDLLPLGTPRDKTFWAIEDTLTDSLTVYDTSQWFFDLKLKCSGNCELNPAIDVRLDSCNATKTTPQKIFLENPRPESSPLSIRVTGFSSPYSSPLEQSDLQTCRSSVKMCSCKPNSNIHTLIIHGCNYPVTHTCSTKLQRAVSWKRNHKSRKIVSVLQENKNSTSSLKLITLSNPNNGFKDFDIKELSMINLNQQPSSKVTPRRDESKPMIDLTVTEVRPQIRKLLRYWEYEDDDEYEDYDDSDYVPDNDYRDELSNYYARQNMFEGQERNKRAKLVKRPTISEYLEDEDGKEDDSLLSDYYQNENEIPVRRKAAKTKLPDSLLNDDDDEEEEEEEIDPQFQSKKTTKTDNENYLFYRNGPVRDRKNSFFLKKNSKPYHRRLGQRNMKISQLELPEDDEEEYDIDEPLSLEYQDDNLYDNYKSPNEVDEKMDISERLVEHKNVEPSRRKADSETDKAASKAEKKPESVPLNQDGTELQGDDSEIPNDPDYDCGESVFGSKAYILYIGIALIIMCIIIEITIFALYFMKKPNYNE